MLATVSSDQTAHLWDVRTGQTVVQFETMRNELTVPELAETIHTHPTYVEAVNEAAEAWLGLPLHGGGDDWPC